MCQKCDNIHKDDDRTPAEKEQDLNKEYAWATVVLFGVIVLAGILMMAADKWGMH